MACGSIYMGWLEPNTYGIYMVFCAEITSNLWSCTYNVYIMVLANFTNIPTISCCSVQVSSDDAIAMARRMAAEEGLMVGISCGCATKVCALVPSRF